mgnify:CR=1 FL=1|jgi:hypothetical protein
MILKILVSAESFGYGPITTCLSVVRELKKHKDVGVDFIGSGISLEQAKLSGFFDNFYLCDTYDIESLKKFDNVFKKYYIFFSSENVNGAIYGMKFIKNTYYVDNLVWMWDKIPNELGKVKKFFISETFPCQDNFKRVGTVIENPIFVGPVRDMKSSSPKNKKNQLVINVGGASSFLFEQSTINEFYNKIINAILSTKEVNQFNSIIICGGSRVIDNLKLEKQNQKIKIATLANEDYLKIMEESSHCIMSSGLGNFIETLDKDINIMYLPAVNYSQLLQLQYYEKMKFGFKNLNWDSFDFYKEIPMYLDEATGVNMVVDNIKQFNFGDYRNLINKFVHEYLSTSQENSFELRKEFFNRFNKNASVIIADTIYSENI